MSSTYLNFFDYIHIIIINIRYRSNQYYYVYYKTLNIVNKHYFILV